jgi:hypothetical protein
MARVNEKTNLWNNTSDLSAPMTKRCGQDGCQWHNMSKILGPLPTQTSLVPGVTDQLEMIKEHQQSALEALQAAQNRMAKETKYKPFKENDKVWLEGTHLKLPYKTMKLALQ